MCMYPMIDFYIESRDVADTTTSHDRELLCRVFTQLKDFGVEIRERSIPGLSGEALQRWLNAFKKTHKPGTVNNHIVTLNPFLRWASTIYPEIGDFSHVMHCMKLPDYDQLPPDERPKEKYYSDDDICRMLEIPANDTPLRKRDRAIIALFAGSGLRVSELCQLTIGHMATRGVVTVRRKGGVYKEVMIADFVYPYIDAYLKTRKDRNNPKAPLFMTTHGTPCNRKQIYESMATRQKEIGTTNALGCHVLRHSFVSNVEKAGGAAVARDLANHKSIVVTNRYDHSTAEQRREAINSMKLAVNLG